MLRKVFCFGLGLAGVLNDKFDELAVAGEERLSQRKYETEQQEVEVTVVVDVSPPVESNQDDLTAINGIGPTFAKRLKEAGISTYSELAAHSADQLKEITRAADWQANPEEWILQAKAVA